MKKYAHIAVFALISLALISPLLLGKYILLLDLIASPSSPHGAKSLGDFIYGINQNGQDVSLEAAQSPFTAATLLLKEIFPISILQKIEAFLIFFLPMLSMYLLLDSKKQIPRYAASVFYAINPFTYMRFMAGHWMLLLAYALLPFLARELIKRKKDFAKIALWLSLVAVFSTHILAMSLILLIVFFRPKDTKAYSFAALAFLLLNSYWIIPYSTTPSSKLSAITESDLTAFRTDDTLVNSIFSSATMYGFWREEAYLMPNIYILLLGFIFLLVIMVHGSIHSKNPLKTRLIIIAIISFILAIGISHPFFEEVFKYLFNYLPFFRGFRDSQKFVALLSLSYSFLLFLGLSKVRNRKILYASFIIPLLIVPPLFATQIKPVDYPSDYYEVNSYLNEDKSDFNVLFLPWHSYLDFSWTKNSDRRIANPAAAFFDKPIITADNIEMYPIYTHSTNPASHYIEKNLNESASRLSLLNIKYILVAKESNTTVKDAIKVKETENLILYKNPERTSRFYESDDLKTFYPLPYNQSSRISFTIQPDSEFAIFTAPYNENWRLGNQPPLKGYPANIFLNFGEKELKYSRFPYIIAGYAISILALIPLTIMLSVKQFKSPNSRSKPALTKWLITI